MSEDPIRWTEAPDAPQGALDLVRSVREPPPLPPDLRAIVIRRATGASVVRRWVGASLAAAVVVGGLLLWRFAPGDRDAVSIAPEPERAPRSAPSRMRDDDRVVAASVPASREVTEPARSVSGDRSGERTARELRPDRPSDRLAQQREGWLTIQSIPWARVFLDGRDLRRNTPVHRMPVPVGRHQVGLRIGDGTMYEETIDVAAGEEHRIARNLLGAVEEHAGDEALGHVVIQTLPSARVFVDGRDTGLHTPVRRLSLDPGRHVLALRTNDGHVHEEEIVIASGEVLRLVRRLDRPEQHAFVAPAARGAHGYLLIQTLPWARVLIDGRDTGRNTPVRRLAVLPGRHTIGLRVEDGTTYTVEVEVEAGQTHRIVRQLGAQGSDPY